ncbi:SusC/RagA family TonB-linked outer membrane protein [Bacteroides congonensis]
MKKELIFLRTLSIMLLCVLFATQANAQGLNISGTVNDDFGPVTGASVLVKGTSNGCITDSNGNFTLSNVSSKGTLVVSFIGYQTQEVPVNNQQKFSINLKEDSQQLQEVVVMAVGYGDVRRKDLTGSIAKADIKELIKTPVNNVAESLGGRIAGVQVSSTDGGLGDNFNIVIRGAGSLTQSTAPLYVIDGFPQETSNMGSLNPNDIESIDVLKDASATAIYGSRGANGVVIITTKKGKSGKPTISYNGSFTIGLVNNTPEMMNGYEFVKLQQEIMGTDDFNNMYLKDGITLEDYRNFKSYDWQKEIYRTALSHNHHVLLNGNAGDLKYSTSVSYNNQQGVIINSDLSRYQGRVNLSQQFNKRLKVDANANFASTKQNGPNPSNNTSSMSTAFMYSVWAYRPVSPSGTDLMEEIYDTDIDMAEDYRFNPVLSAKNEYRRNITNTLQANLSAEYEIVKNLKLKVAAGYSSRDIKKEEFNGPNTRTGNSHPSNTQSKGINAKLYQYEFRSYLNENTLTYQFNKKRHSMNVLAGLSLQKNSDYAHSVATEHISNESFGMAGLDKGTNQTIESNQGESKMMSYFGRINYNYDSRYYLNATMRADGSSKFPKNNRWGYFPSASAAWAFGREAFVSENASWLSNGKLRVSYGQTGNNRVGDFDYMAKLITSDDVYKYPWNGTFTPGFHIANKANSQLKWETTEQIDFGLDLGFFDGRINVTADYYIKTTKDLLLQADVPGSSGFSSATLNVGKLENKGFELTLETINLKNKKFSWTSNFNIAFNSNKITALTEGKGEITSYISWDNKYKTMPAYVSRIGESAGKMYGFIYEGTYKESDFDITTDGNGKKVYTLKDGIASYVKGCQPGDPKYRDIPTIDTNGDGIPDTGDGVINDDDRTTIGDGLPKCTGGFTNSFTYKNWDLSIFLQWSLGNDILNANRMVFENPAKKKNTNMFASYADRWSPENPNSNMPRANALGSNEYSSLYVEDGSFLKLKTISLGYNFPAQLLRKAFISSARIFVSAENIATITGYSGPDPEVSTRNSVLTPGFDWSAYPRSFNASIGVNLTF